MDLWSFSVAGVQVCVLQPVLAEPCNFLCTARPVNEEADDEAG